MGRSLQIKNYKTWNKEKNEWESKNSDLIQAGSGLIDIYVPSDFTTIEFDVMVDGDELNGSFFVDIIIGWKNYNIIRNENSIHVIFKLPNNIEPLEKYGIFEVKHKSSDISVKVNVTQQENKYTLNYHYDEENGCFEEFPITYQEKSVTIVANGGSKKWYVKEILQYEAHEDFQEWELKGEDIPEERNEVPVEYNGAFTYFITNGNKLTVRSYGRLDLSKQHMRYYFVIVHKDVDNGDKKIYNDYDIPNEYEKKILFFFKPNDEDDVINYKDGIYE